MPPENDRNADKAKSAIRDIPKGKKKLGSSRWILWFAVALVVAAVATVLILLKATSVSEARKLNTRGLEKFGTHDYEGAVAEYTSALNNPKATATDKSISLYLMATAKKAGGDADGAISDFLDLVKLPDADVETRCMAAEDFVPMLIERAGRRFDKGDIFGATKDCEDLSSIDNTPPELKAQIEEGLKKLTMPGSVQVDTNPRGAKISADGKECGVSPMTVDGLARGTHDISISLVGYKDVSSQIIVKPGAEIKPPTFILERKTGKLEISTGGKTSWTIASAPADATLTNTSGAGDASLDKLPVGEYSVEFSREGWTKAIRTVAIEENGVSKIACDFVGGAVAVNVGGAGTTWEICTLKNGVASSILHGDSSAFISDFPPGVYIVKFNREGWPQEKETLMVETGKASVVEHTFAGCRIEIASVPPGAKITGSEGKFIGTTPYVIDDAIPGEVCYSLSLENYTTAQIEGTAVPGKTLALNANLKKTIPTPEEGSDWTVPSCGMEMKWIPNGSFVMGSLPSEKYGSDDETAHQVTILRGFWMGRYEVTSAQWKTVMGAASKASVAGDRIPVGNVTWNEAMEFCRKLTESERAAGRLPPGCVYALPTEAQWEYACRAGTATRFSFGDEAGYISDYGNTNGLIEATINPPPATTIFSEDEAIARSIEHGGSLINPTIPKRTNSDDGFEKAAPAGSFKPNAFGIFDMCGNVKEWCLDNYGSYPDYAVEDPADARNGSRKVCRGGSWKTYAYISRSAARDSEKPSNRDEDIGLRVALVSATIDASKNPR